MRLAAAAVVLAPLLAVAPGCGLFDGSGASRPLTVGDEGDMTRAADMANRMLALDGGSAVHGPTARGIAG